MIARQSNAIPSRYRRLVAIPVIFAFLMGGVVTAPPPPVGSNFSLLSIGALPEAAADPCGSGCGGGGSSGPDLGGGSQFQPPQMPLGPSQSANPNSYPGLDQLNGVSIYNTPPQASSGGTADYPAVSVSQPGQMAPANGVQPHSYEGTTQATTTKLSADWQSFADGRVRPNWCLVCGAPHGGVYHADYCSDCIVSGEAPPGILPVVP